MSLPLLRKSNIENEGKVDFPTHAEERKCHFHFDALHIEVTVYWRSSEENKLHHLRRFLWRIHHSRVHQLQKKFHFEALLLENVMKKPTTKTSRPALEEDSQWRHILHPKIWPIEEDQTHSSRLLEKNFNFFLKKGPVKTSIDHDYIHFQQCVGWPSAWRKNISTLKKLSNQHQHNYLRKINSCSKNVASMRRYLRKKFICV